MHLVAKWTSQKGSAWVIIGLTLVLAIVSGMYAVGVQQDDDLLAFLPEGNPDIDAFYQINERFGGLDVALVGIETRDVFDAAFLETLTTLTHDIRDTAGVDHVLSLANVEDFRVDPMGGIVASELIDAIPADAEQQADLRSKVMSRDQVVGNLVSSDGKAVLMYVFAAHGSNPRELANTVGAQVEQAFPDENKYYGGSPFISTYIYDSTQADMKRLTPWAVIAIIVIILASFRDWLGSLLALFTTGMGIVVSRGAMGFMDVSFNIVLSGMPVILFAVGSAYSIHMLSRYYANAMVDERRLALERTIVETGPTVIAAGLTTVVGLMSFITMDIAPMRTFGIYTAIGILTTLVLSVTFVPAVISVVNLGGKQMSAGTYHRATLFVSGWARENRGACGGVLVGLAVLGFFYVGQVDTRMDQTAFFQPDSPPDNAQRFLDTYFGGSQFLQVHVTGNMGDPHVLREMQRFADRIRTMEMVSQVLVISDPVGAVNDAMQGAARIPDTPDQVGALFGFLSGNAGARQLVTDDKSEGLIHVKIASNKSSALDRVVAEVDALVRDEVVTAYRVATVGREKTALDDRLHRLTIDRIAGLGAFYGFHLDDALLQEQVPKARDAIPDSQRVEAQLAAFFQSEECFVDVSASQAAALAKVTVGLGRDADADSWRDVLTDTLRIDGADPSIADEEIDLMVDDLMLSAESVLAFYWRQAQGIAGVDGVLARQSIVWEGLPEEGRFRTAVGVALMNLDNPTGMVADTSADAETISFEINGLPVLYRGMSESVTANQAKSLAFALGLVWLIMTGLFRSALTGLLATAPTALTLVVVYGGMGLRGVHLDIGTSMLGSIIIGAGVDYAVHFMAAWRGATTADALAHSIEETAPAIWTNALMVSAGFFVLTLGEARPLQNVGGLTSVAMVVAAFMTFLVIPLLARKNEYGRGVAKP